MTVMKSNSQRIPLLVEYALGWCLHQLVPFLDKILGVAGAMDHRMIDRSYDWYIRLPLVLLCVAFPDRRSLLVAHVVNIVCWFDRMPAVWDYMCWCALMEVTFVVAALVSSSNEELSKKFLPAVRAQLIVLYFSAAFWKLTTSWFDLHYSCTSVLMSELLSGLEPLLPPLTLISHFMMQSGPALVAGMEFAVPILLLLNPQLGVLLALTFHQTINLMPTTYAGGFSIAMCCRLLIFLPGCGNVALNGKFWTQRLLTGSSIVALATGLMYRVHNGLDCHGSLFLVFCIFYFMAISADLLGERPQEFTDTMPTPASAATSIPKMLVLVAMFVYGSYASVVIALFLLVAWSPLALTNWVSRSIVGVAGLAVFLGFLYGFLFPVFGVMMMASSTMYGNVQNYGSGNHMLVPTGLLQTWMADAGVAAAAPTSLADFGGGLVRVERTTSTTLLQLQVRGAEGTEKLPARARELLKSVNASGRYFEFYAARNYFDRKGDYEACALNGIPEAIGIFEQPDSAYVVPMYELRRELVLARDRSEQFELTYTRIPPHLGMPSRWKAYAGRKVTINRGNATASCVVVDPDGTTAECDESELAELLKPPSWWLTKLLHPYPTPLLEGAGDGVHCTT